MPANTVEAVLSSKYEDGIADGVENTRALMEKAFSSMSDAGAAAASGVESAFESAVGSLETWRTSLSKAADDSDNNFKKIGLGAAAVGVAMAEVALRGAKAAADWVIDVAKEASEVAEARVNFEALTAAQGINADQMLTKLKTATEGQVDQLTLMRNANKVMTADLPLTSEQYVKLTENVTRLAKSSGTDAVAAQDALTEALIRGQTRALGPAIGIHLSVAGSVRTMAGAMNDVAGGMPDRASMQAMYNDLIAQTDAAVSKLPPKFLTLDEVLTEAHNTWKDFLDDVGTAITRSGVFQALLEKGSAAMDGMNSTMDQQHQMALEVNNGLISIVRGFATLIAVLAPAVTAFEWLKAGVTAAVFMAIEVVLRLADVVVTVVGTIVQALSKLPGAAGAAFQPMVQQLSEFRDTIETMGNASKDGLDHAFDGVGTGGAKMNALAASARGLANEMETLKGTVLDGAAGIQKQGQAAQQAAADQKTLTDQLSKYREMLSSLNQATATPEQKLMNDLTKQVAEIGKLDKISADQRNELYAAAWAKYNAAEAKQLADEEAKQNAADDKKYDEARQQAQKVLDLETQFAEQNATEEQKASIKREQDIRKVASVVGLQTAEGKQLLLLIEKNYDAEMDKIAAARLAKEQEAAKKAVDALIASGDIAALKKKLAEIQALPVISDTQIAEVNKLSKAINDLQTKAIDKAIAAANSITHVMEAAAKGTVSQSVAMTQLSNLPQTLDQLKKKLAELNQQPIVTDAQINEVTKLQTAINSLNKLNFAPFTNMLTQMQNQMQNFATKSLNSFSQYLGGLISGQGNATTKLLQMASQMIGGLFSMAGQLLMQTGVAECAAALTMVGRALGASFETGAMAIAAGVALSALGSAMGGSGGSGGGASAPSGSSQSVSQQNANQQNISVGAPGSTTQSGAANTQTQHLIQLEISPTNAYIVKAVQNNIGQNGVLRTLVKNTANG